MFYNGVVVHGRKLGRQIGFPTANMEPVTQFSNLRNGVYSVEVLHNGEKYLGVMNIGKRPTVDKAVFNLTVEVHILDFNKQIYGQSLEIKPLSFIRNEKEYKNLEELKTQILVDIQCARKTISERVPYTSI
jgi:riboflavin kinase